MADQRRAGLGILWSIWELFGLGFWASALALEKGNIGRNRFSSKCLDLEAADFASGAKDGEDTFVS